MAKQRMIYSDVWEDDFFTSLSIFHRLLWIGIITSCADDQGRFQDNAALVRSKVFPVDDVPIKDIEAGLEAFATAHRIDRYLAGGKRVAQIVNWWKYQSPRWAGASIYPPPTGWTDRERYHTTGNAIIENNWGTKGGYLATYLGDSTGGNTTDDGEVKGDVNGDVNDELPPTPPPPPPPDADLEYGQLVTAYHQNIGQVTKMVGETLADDLKEYGLQWCLDAIQEAVLHEARSWAYCQKILKRWKREGRGTKQPDNGKGNGRGKPEELSFEEKARRMYAEQQEARYG